MARIYEAKEGITIPLGRRGENEALQVRVNIESWISDYGNGTFGGLAQRPGDEEPYPVTITLDGNFACWTVDDVDTAVEGFGRYELDYFVGDVLAKSMIWRTETQLSMADAGPVPEPYESWVEDVLAAGASVLNKIDKVAGATAGHLPQLKSSGDIEDSGVTLMEIPRYGVCDTAADTAYKTVTVAGFSSLAAGAKVSIKFTNTNTAADPRLNVNSTGNRPIAIYGTTLATPSQWKAGSVIDFTYDGTRWIIAGVSSVDATLTAPNVAGDAKVIGDKLGYLNDEIQISNLFDVQSSQLGYRMMSDGTISASDGYIVSDFMDVTRYAVEKAVLYFSESVAIVEVLDSTKTRIRIGQSLTQLNLGASGNANVRYIRISCTVSVANRLTIAETENPDAGAPYGAKTQRPVVNAAVDRQIGAWYTKNIGAGEENMVATATGVTFASTSGFRVFDNTDGYPYAYKGFSNSDDNVDIRFTLPGAVSVVGVQAFEVVCYIEGASNINSLQMSFLSPSASTYSRGVAGSALKNGWNRVRINTAQQDALTASTWSTLNAFRLLTQGSGEHTITYAAVNLERRDTAKLLFVDDHGYHGFKTLAYPLLKAAGQPVTWAINPGRLGEVISTSESILTQADIDELAFDAYSEFSFHNWNPNNNPTETMTPDELRQDFQKCITYLRKNGICPTHLWRAAYTQNKADSWWVAQDLVEATASHTASAGFSLWPFSDPFNVVRYSIHRRPQEDIDDVFTKLQLTHTTMVLYTHGCVVERDPNIGSDGLHCTVAEIEYICGKIEAGISEGWLEPTTYSRLATLRENGLYSLVPPTA